MRARLLAIASLALWVGTGLASKYATPDVNDVAVLLMREGINLDEKGKMWEAARKFRAAAKHDPYSSQHRNNLGLCLYRLGFFFADLNLLLESAEEFEAALKLAPPHMIESTRSNAKLVDAAFRERYPHFCKWQQPWCYAFHERYYPSGSSNLQLQVPLDLPSSRQRLLDHEKYLQMAREYEQAEQISRREQQRLAEEEDEELRGMQQQPSQPPDHAKVSFKPAASRNPAAKDRACLPAELRMDLGGEDAEGRVLNGMQKVAEVLRRCGVIVLERVFDVDLVAALAREQGVLFRSFHEAVHANRSLENSTTSGLRSEGRWEVKLPLVPPFTSPNLIANPALFSLLKRVLGTEEIELDTLSSVTSVPGSPAQHWHADVDDLFRHGHEEGGWGEQSEGAVLPAFGIVVFLPLSDVGEKQGPTEFLLGSHLNAACASSSCPARASFVATAPLGSAILFDVRITHRGGANVSPRPRAMAYMSFVRAWFRDSVNFHSPHTASFDSFESRRLRRLLARLDQIEYLRTLEKALGSTTVAALRSSRKYSPLDYAVVE